MHAAVLQSGNPDRTLIWAICNLAFFGFFCLGELLVGTTNQYHPATCLSCDDVVVDSTTSPTMIKVHLKCSKSYQAGRGKDVIVGNANSPICPVVAVLDCIKLKKDHPGAFNIHKGREAVKKVCLVQQVGQILQSLGLPQDDYAGHSFCTGAPTSAALAEVKDSTIQVLRRWHSAAFLQYVRFLWEQLARIFARLSSATCTVATTAPRPFPNSLSNPYCQAECVPVHLWLCTWHLYIIGYRVCTLTLFFQYPVYMYLHVYVYVSSMLLLLYGFGGVYMYVSLTVHSNTYTHQPYRVSMLSQQHIREGLTSDHSHKTRGSGASGDVIPVVG